jgi:predicted cupin superfamily sugar epimerase
MLHRLQSDELWFFHHGQPLEIIFIQEWTMNRVILGNAFEKGEISSDQDFSQYVARSENKGR